MGRPLIAFAIIGCCLFIVTEADASPFTLVDSYTLSTQNPVSLASWGYENFFGAKWGTYEGPGHDALHSGVNMITGSENTVLTPEICLGFLGCIPETTGDTRNGVAIDFSSSGRVGIDVKAEASAGTLDITVPVRTNLTIDDSQTGKLTIGASSLLTGGVITATAPSFKASIDGVINLDNSVKATGCLIFDGCSSTDPITLNVDPGQFPLLGLDTTKDKPLSVFGLPLPVSFGHEYEYRLGVPPCQGPATADGVAPICDTGPLSPPRLVTYKFDNPDNFTGGTLDSTQHVLSVSKNQQLLTVNADLPGIAEALYGAPVDVLNPHFSLGKVDIKIKKVEVGSISGSLFDLQAGGIAGVMQTFSFDPSFQVDLHFDKPVTWKVVQQTGESCEDFLFFEICLPVYELVDVTSTDVPLPTNGQHLDLAYTGGVPNLLSRTYSMQDGVNNLTTSLAVTLNPDLDVRAACIQFKVIGLIDTGLNCAFHEVFQPDPPSGIFNAYSTESILAGFNTATFEGVPESSAPVPEPATLTLLGLGLAGAVCRCKRQELIRYTRLCRRATEV